MPQTLDNIDRSNTLPNSQETVGLRKVDDVIAELRAQYDRNAPNLINGVYVPSDVIAQLREIGIPLTSFSAGELRAAISACSDGRLIDDVNGNSFMDQLSLTAGENNKAAASVDDSPDDDDDDQQKEAAPKKRQCSFCQRIKQERAKKIIAIASGESQESDLPSHN